MTRGRPRLAASPARAKLLKGAQELLKRRGYQRLTVEGLCEKCGLSKMSFYRHFKNKEALVITILEEFFAGEVDWVREVIDLDLDYEVKLDQVLSRRELNFKKLGSRFIEELNLMKSPELQKFFAYWQAKINEVNLEFLELGKKQGKVSKKISNEFFLFLLKYRNELKFNSELKAICPKSSERHFLIDEFFYYGLKGR